MWVRDLAAATPACGGKAQHLARLIAGGLPVPPGFALEDGAFRALAGAAPTELAAIGHALAEAAHRIAHGELPAELVADVRARAAALGPDLVVRSSCSIEDADGGAAAGVFQSVAESSARVWDAIRAVWASALTPLAIGYARGRPFAVGVVVQRRERGAALTVYTRPPDDATADRAWVQRGTAIAHVDRAAALRAADAADDDARAVRIALQAARAIGAEATGADVELVGDWCVQARPIVRRAAPAGRPPPPPAIVAGLVADGRTWTFDAAHNPAPLSVAQAGLVELVERAGVAPWHLRVVGGYLYTTARDAPPPPAPPLAALADIEARLAQTLQPPRDLADALDRYVAFYAIWARELSPLVAAALRARDRDALLAQRPPRIRALLADRALDESQVLAALGDLSPAWDVAVPTYAETPARIRDAIARARALPETATATATDPLAELAERDDDWFYRAQAMVRRALLARGLGDDIFWLPLDTPDAIDPIDARRRAAAARSAAARAAGWQMPLRIPAGPAAAPKAPLHGRGIGPRVRGVVVRVDPSEPLAPAIPPGAIVVCQSVTPALAVLVIGAAAIVSEAAHVGLLDHAIALARELGITCVVDCHDAWARLPAGTHVTVDGDRGSVELST